MIDIHVHILPGLDDGARTTDESVDMASRAASDGVKLVVATPHSGISDDGLPQKVVEDGVAKLQSALDERGIELVLLPGVEIYISPFTAEQARPGRVFSLNQSRYVLIELPIQVYPPYTDQVLFELQVKGYVPVLAHPERYSAFQKEVEHLYNIVRRGVMVQVTAGSIVGHFGRRVQQTAEVMLQHNLVHVIASDAHDSDARPPVLSKAVEYAAKTVGQEQATAMVTSVPEAIINNRVPRLPEPIPVMQKKGWAFWR